MAWRRRAIRPVTLCAGSCPLRGLAPWAILISSSSACWRYSGVTPNRARHLLDLGVGPLAGKGPSAKGCHQAGSSPPSPVLERAPIRFMPTARWRGPRARGPPGHGLGREATHDRLGRLHLVQRDGRAQGHKVEDVPQGPRGATVDELAVGPVVGVLPAAGRLLHRHHGQAVVAVELAVLLVADKAQVGQAGPRAAPGGRRRRGGAGLPGTPRPARCPRCAKGSR